MVHRPFRAERTTGVVLAGGRGERMGGRDKGLVELNGRPLFEHVLARLRPQVGELMIIANRNAETYRKAGVPVVGDEVPAQGPLGGIATALAKATTPDVLIVPCDVPLLPEDLSERLHRARGGGAAEILVAHDGAHLQMLCALLRVELLDSLRRFLSGPERAVHAWYARHRVVPVDFSDSLDAFVNVNTPSDHAALARAHAPGPRGEAEHRTVSVDDALARYDSEVAALEVETVSIDSVLHRVLAAPAHAHTDLPAFSQSAMDGYALRADDSMGAEKARPVRLHVVGEVFAGPHAALPTVRAGEALRIFTGAPLPEGCDAVARQEHVKREDAHILLTRAVPAGNDVRFRGEELKAQAVLAPAGRRVGPGLLAAMSMAGVETVPTHRRPRVHVLVTGDEVVTSGRPPRPGEVPDANGRLIRAWLLARGAPEPRVEHVPDDARALETALRKAWETADLVITSGGVSVGERDWVPEVAERLGAEPLFRNVAQKPGKPLYFARRDEQFLLGLPGNPAAALVGLVVHARRILDRMEGHSAPGPRFHPGRLAARVPAMRDRVHWIRARRELGPEGVVLHPLGNQGAHMLSNLSEADSLIRVPAGESRLEATAPVTWTPLDTD